MKKGFIISFSVLLLFSLLVVFSMTVAEQTSRENEQVFDATQMHKLGLMADDFETDLNALLGVQVDVNSSDIIARVEMHDKLPPDFNRERLADWQNFATAFAARHGVVFSPNLGALTDGQTELLIGGGLQYANTSNAQSSGTFHSTSGATGAKSYDISVFVPLYSSSVEAWSWDPSGDLNVTLNYVDFNSLNTVSVSGRVNAALANTYTIRYDANGGGFFSVTVGNVDGNAGALRFVESIDLNTVQAQAGFTVLRSPALSAPEPRYAADLNLSLGEARMDRQARVMVE